MDNFEALKHILAENTLQNLETLHNCRIITATSGHSHSQKILRFEFSSTIGTLMTAYEYKDSIKDVEDKLLVSGTHLIVIIWNRKIIVLSLELRICCKFCGLNKYDYIFKNTSYFLELEIDDNIFDSRLKNIIKWPTKRKISDFLKNTS